MNGRTSFHFRVALLYGPLLMFVALIALAGCRTPPKITPINLSEPGWKVREGQAVWQNAAGAPGIAGDLLVATHASGASLVQFSKTPLPLVSGRIQDNRWQMEFIPAKMIKSGRGQPPARLIWLHLAPTLEGKAPPAPLEFSRVDENSWELHDCTTNEKLTVYLTP